MAVDSTCPVCRTADIVCGKWTLLLVRELAHGHSRFCELERSLAGISPRTLSLRLRALEEQAIVEGRALLPIIDDMRTYGESWLTGEEPAAEGALSARTAALAAA